MVAVKVEGPELHQPCEMDVAAGGDLGLLDPGQSARGSGQASHLGKEDGQNKRSGYSAVMERALKSELSFCQVQTLCPTEFLKKYSDHLYRLHLRWTLG